MRKLASIGLAMAALQFVPADGSWAQVRQQGPGPAPQAAPPQGRRDPANAAAFAGRFRCIWTSPEGYVYECEMQLRNTSDTDVEGRIQWTLARTPRPADQAKVGQSGAELVRGAVDGPGKINMAGYEKADPNGVIGLDEYRLELSGSARWLFGITGNHGKWNANFSAIRY